MHEGVMEYFTCAVGDALNSTYYDQWISGGPTARPPRLPDMNPLNFHLWGYLKTLGYAVPVDNKEALHYHIVEACRIIRNYPSIFKRMWQSMMRSVKAHIQSHRGCFEHLL
jgi:hypothetical protein